MQNQNMNYNIFSTATLAWLSRSLITPSSFFLDNFFPVSSVSNTQFIAIDIEVNQRRMAPFVSPLVEGKLVESKRVDTKMFKPPYIKDKRAPDLETPMLRQIGEQIGGGDLTPNERFEAIISAEIADQLYNLKRREEWMAVQSILHGFLVVKGDGYPEAVINYDRDPRLSIVLSGTDSWDAENSTANPLEDIQDWSIEVLGKSGAQITDLVFTTSAYYSLPDKQSIQPIFMGSAIRGNNDMNLSFSPDVFPGAMLKGYLGTVRVWLYNEWYVDDENETRPMIPDGYVLGISDQLQGLRAYGAIRDPDIGYVSVPYSTTMWKQKDPANLFLMMQSAPLPIPTRINATFAARVVKGKQNG